jgi:predicted outer membrane repeat protein
MTRPTFCQAIRFVSALSLLVAWTTNPMRAATTALVTTTSDSGAGSLRDALENAVSGEVISFQLSGCPCVISLTTGPLNSIWPVTIAGPGADLLTLDGNQTFTVIQAYAPITITNLRISNGYADGNTPNWFSGGGLLATHGPITLEGLVFENNRAASYGGGLAFPSDNSYWVAITNTQFISNTAYYFGGGLFSKSTAHVAGSLFQKNSVTSASNNGLGAGMHVQADTFIQTTRFISNTASDGGGGLYVQSGFSHVANSLFQGNQSGEAGGGAHMLGPTYFTNTVFFGNVGDVGGGLARGGPITITNGLFAGNEASSAKGAAIQFDYWWGPLSIRHTTIAQADVHPSSAIYLSNGGLHMTNTVVTSHTIGIDNSIGVTVLRDYTLFSGIGTNVSGTETSGLHNLYGPANFIDPPRYDYRLGSGSDAIDTGTDLGITFDLLGFARPLAGFDMGAYEFAAARVFLILVQR